MPEPKSKSKIIKQLQAERRRLENNLAGLSQADMLQPGVVKEWSIKDVLAHLADWEGRFIGWYTADKHGEKVETPAPGISWKNIDPLNQQIYLAHRDQPLEVVLAYFRLTHQDFMSLVESIPEEEILAPGLFYWIGKAPLYNWLAGFAAHDRWGKTKIRHWLKTRG